MELKNSEIKKNKPQDLVFIGLIAVILFSESVLTIIASIRKGFYKKEVLSKKSTLGFDCKIIMK